LPLFQAESSSAKSVIAMHSVMLSFCPGRKPPLWPLWPLSALRAHTEAPYKTDLLWKTLGALNRPMLARTVSILMMSMCVSGSPFAWS
jgi:hypothetical protein